jgi:hypothetical protein
MVTVLTLGVHVPLEIVQLKTYVLPAVPVKVDVPLDGVPNVPAPPLTMAQAPVPTVGVLPARVTLLPQTVCGAPAAAVVGAA